MPISGQAGPGKIRLFNDFCGPEIPVLNAVAYGTTAGGCNYYLGDFTVKGDLGETDTGVVALSKASGYVRIGYNDEDAAGVWVGTEICFSPALNGTMILECRCEHRAITTKSVFIGFMGTAADNCLEPITSTTTTCTRAANAVGFLFDSQITRAATAATAFWLMPYMISGTTSQEEGDIDASQLCVAGESDVLRIEVDMNGAARWYINGKLEQSVGAALAADTTTLLAGGVGVWGTDTTDSDIDVDYLLIEANRDWTR